ncbi:MAG: anti-sigma factor [Xanthobacteraceae bacterium]
MSDVQDHSEFSGDELLAAEYALGVLAGADRATAERRMARDRAFAALVTAWERRLAPWAGEITEVTQPPDMWDRIAAELPAASPQRAGFWNSLAFWRGFGIASAFAAACLAVLVYSGVITHQPPLIATVESGGRPLFVATIDTKRHTIAVVPAAFIPDPTRIPELWLIGADGKPRAVGPLRADRTVVIALPPELSGEAKSNAALAVSLEPPGASTDNGPTGPVIGQGILTNL